MLRKIATYVGYALLWVLVFGVIFIAQDRVKHHRAEQRVSDLIVDVSGGGKYPLLDAEYLRGWILQECLSPINRVVGEVNIAEIEAAAMRHAAIERANAYMTYDGELHLDVVRRQPVARLRLDGYDAYITADGYIIPAKECFSVPVMVVTGDYKPHFDRNYAGYASDVVRNSIEALSREIDSLEMDKFPLYEAIEDHRDTLRTILGQKLGRSLFSSKDEDSILRAQFSRYKSEARNRYRYMERGLNAKIAELDIKQDGVRRRQELLRNEALDFEALVAFLTRVDGDSYWRSEIVQIVVGEDAGGRIELMLIPRSGRFTVDLGTTEELDTKLANLNRFYRKGLSNIGWDRCESISLRYRNQVVSQ